MTGIADIVIEDARWQAFGLAAVADRAARAVAAQLGMDPALCQLVVMGCDDARIAGLNAQFREKPTPTNVLSWPSEERGAEYVGEAPVRPTPGTPDAPAPLGDIAIAWETCSREAELQEKSFDDHVTHLLVHGILHLLGYDHIEDEDAELMEQTERQILASLGIADPY